MTDFAILCTLQTEKYAFLCSLTSKNLTFSCIFRFFIVPLQRFLNHEALFLYTFLQYIAMATDYLSILSDQLEELRQTPWESIITRKEEQEVNLNSPLAQVVIGVRRSGKSTLCAKVMMESKLPFGYINFDDDRLGKLTRDDFDPLLQTLYRLNGDFKHLLLDEVQNIEGWELFVNRMLRQGMRVIITGSNANLLSGDLATHLTGRHHKIELYPFSFHEYCQAHNVDITSYSTKAIALRERALDEYLFQGGFPELLNLNEAEQTDYVRSLVRTIVEKDIAKRYKIRYVETLKNIADQVLDEFTNEQSSSSIQEKHHLSSAHTAKNYLQYIQNAYLVYGVPRFSLKSIERRSVNKYYAMDNAMVAKREGALLTESMGPRLENIVAIELKRRASIDDQIYYLRKVREYEVDFVRVRNHHVQELIQVTYDFREPSTKLFNREVGNLFKAGKLLRCDNLTLVMAYGEKRDIVQDDKTVHCVLASDWLLQQ